MCGRYGRWSRRQRIEELLGIEPSANPDFPALYNITPGVETWIARAKDRKPTLYTLYSYLWGLVPYWSKDPKKGARPVNARAETAHEKPMFRKLIRERRCLIPANCYYEWKRTKIGKTPYCIRMEDESPFAAALRRPLAGTSSDEYERRDRLEKASGVHLGSRRAVNFRVSGETDGCPMKVVTTKLISSPATMPSKHSRYVVHSQPSPFLTEVGT
jgi:hypothetical protein